MIEVVVSIGILSICIICAVTLVNNLIGSNEDRIIKDEVSKSLYAICSEIKYNVSYNDMKNEIKDKKLILKYDKKFLNEISNGTLLSINKNGKNDEKIEIELIEYKEGCMTIKVRIIYKDIVEEKNILKAPWMDYV